MATIRLPIPSDLKDSVVRAYPDGKMKAVVISLDDGADWCYESDKRAMDILKAHNAKATYGINLKNLSHGSRTTATRSGTRRLSSW